MRRSTPTPLHPLIHAPQLSKSSASCSSSKRRRSHTASTRVSRRRRTDCPPSFSSNVFDTLPWIAQVERAPQRADIWDLADLSLLPDDSPYLSSGAGPVRRRRTSSRSGVPPLGGGMATEAAASGRGTFPHMVPASHAKRDARGDDERLLPMQLLPAFDRESCDLRTPPPSYALDPRDVTFDRLMPILPTFDPALRPSPRDLSWSRSSTPSPL